MADAGRLLPYGDRAVLFELPDLAAVVAVHRVLRADLPAGVIDLVPAARTVLVRFEPRTVSLARVAAWLQEHAAAAAGTAPDPEPASVLVEIPVRYDGVDLADVAELTGLTVDEVVRRHAAATYTVAFCGFVPGFGYLAGGDPALRVSRLASPRTRIPAGSVAIADEYTGIYPRESPGGWRLIGRTGVRLWDLDRDPPALLTPGTRVRFVSTGAYDAEHDDSAQDDADERGGPARGDRP